MRGGTPTAQGRSCGLPDHQRHALVVDPTIGEHRPGYATSFDVPPVADMATRDISMRDWSTILLGNRSVDIAEWLT